MRKFIIAAAVAATASMSFAAGADAATVVIRSHDHPRMHHRHCYNKKVVIHRHGRTIIKHQRVCR